MSASAELEDYVVENLSELTGSIEAARFTVPADVTASFSNLTVIADSIVIDGHLSGLPGSAAHPDGGSISITAKHQVTVRGSLMGGVRCCHAD